MKSCAVLVAAMVALTLVSGAQNAGAQQPIQPASVDIVAGERLYAKNCASCHGADLEGQADWRSPGADGRLPAPPHDKTGHTWHHGDEVLFDYTKLGGKAVLAAQGMEFNSGMPGFSESLTDQQIWDILAYIKSTWPARERDVQSARSPE